MDFENSELIDINSKINSLRERVIKEYNRRSIPNPSFDSGNKSGLAIRSNHIQELRDDIDCIKNFTFTDNPLIPNIHWVKEAHLNELDGYLRILEKTDVHDKNLSCNGSCLGLCASCTGTCSGSSQTITINEGYWHCSSEGGDPNWFSTTSSHGFYSDMDADMWLHFDIVLNIHRAGLEYMLMVDGTVFLEYSRIVKEIMAVYI